MASRQYIAGRPSPEPFRDASLGTPVITVVDPITGSTRCTVDRFYSFRWVERYMDAGEFELEGPLTEYWAKVINEGDYLFFSHSGFSYLHGPGFQTAMIVESKYTKSDSELGKRIFCNGRTLESLLDRRVNFGVRYGALRSFKDGPLFYDDKNGGVYALAVRDCSHKSGLTKYESSGYRPDWFDHHAPLRCYDLIPSRSSRTRPADYYEGLALAVVACNCGCLARTNRQFEYFEVARNPYNASHYPEENPDFEPLSPKNRDAAFVLVDAPLTQYGAVYQSDGWYSKKKTVIDIEKESTWLFYMTNDEDRRYPWRWKQSIEADMGYDETRYDSLSFTMAPGTGIVENQVYKKIIDALHPATDPYSGVGEDVLTIVKTFCGKCDGVDGGWGFKLTAQPRYGGYKLDWWTDQDGEVDYTGAQYPPGWGFPNKVSPEDCNPRFGSRPHRLGHVGLAFELYKGRDLTVNGPHKDDGKAVIFSEVNENVKYIDYLHSTVNEKNVIIRLTGLEYTVERVWEFDWRIRELDSIVKELDNKQTLGQTLSEDDQKRREASQSELDKLKAERENIQKGLEQIGMTQQYYSTLYRDSNDPRYSEHYPTGITRREMCSTEDTKSDSFVSAVTDPYVYDDYNNEDYQMQSAEVVYPGRAAKTVDVWRRIRRNYDDSGSGTTKEEWKLDRQYPQWGLYAEKLSASNRAFLDKRENSVSNDIETEVDYNAFQIAGQDYNVGDLVTLVANMEDLRTAYGKDYQWKANETGFRTMRCDEIAYSIDSSGFVVVPTFKILEDPDQSTEIIPPGVEP